MKKTYTILALLFMTLVASAQNNYEYSLSFLGTNGATGNYQIALIATPNFNQSTDARTADMTAAFYLPSAYTVGNFEMGDSNIPAGNWTIDQENTYDGGTTDLIGLWRADGSQVDFTHTSSQPITLLKFDVVHESGGANPTTGEIILAENDDPNAMYNFYENYMSLDTDGNNFPEDFFPDNSITSNSVNFSTLSIDNDLALADLEVSVYPNPTSDVLNLTVKNTAVTYAMFNLLGQSVELDGSVSENSRKSIRLNHLPDGIYILKVEDDNKLLQKSFKIIKKK